MLDTAHADLQALTALIDRVDQQRVGQQTLISPEQTSNARATPKRPVDCLEALDHPAEGRRIPQVGPAEFARGHVELTEYPLGLWHPPLRRAAEDRNDAAHGPEGRAKPGATTPAAPCVRSTAGCLPA